MANIRKKQPVSVEVAKKLYPETPQKEETKQEVPQSAMTRYKFIANCNNLNVNNVIFNNIKVVIYEVDAPNYEAAFENFKNAVIAMFNGNVPNYNKFMRAVFGDDILVESVAVENIKQDIAKLG